MEAKTPWLGIAPILLFVTLVGVCLWLLLNIVNVASSLGPKAAGPLDAFGTAASAPPILRPRLRRPSKQHQRPPRRYRKT